MLSSLSDEECIRRFQQGSEEAVFNCLLNRHRMSIRRIIFSILRGSVEDIEDIEQEVAMALYQGLARFSFKSTFKTYLYRLCRNKTIDFIRRKEKQKNLIRKIFQSIPERVQESPDKIMERMGIRNNLAQTLFELPELERSLIILKDIEHLSLKEIGEVLNKPLGTVKSRLHRARLHAAEIYKKKGDY